MPENNNAGHGDKPQVAGGYDARRPLLESPLKPLVNQLDPQQPEEGAVKADEAVEAELDEAALFTVPPMAVKIGKEIGKGAFSVVYAGEYRRAAVAVKCQPKDAEGRIPPFVLREVQVLSRLRHPRLLQFVGAADHAKAKQVWILSEFSNNGDVDQLLRAVRKGTQPHPGWEALVRVALDAADGLHFLQSLHILHRDIKSSNILLDAKLRAKLCDFGFATDLVPFSTDAVSSTTADMGDAGASGAVRRKSYCGTDAYMAPEMFLDEDYDERVDVFSFGVVLMEMLCCRTANADGFLLRLPQNKFRIALSEFQDALPVSCPPVLARLAERCVAFEPRDRPSIDEVVRTLRQLVDDRENASALAAVVELRQFVPAELEPQIVEDDEYYGENDDDDDGDDEDEDDDDDDDDEEDEDDTLVRSDTIDLDADVEGRDIVSQRVDEPFLDDVDEDEGEDKLQPLQQIPATPAPYHAGVILKRGRRGNRTWTEKWFILDHDHLHYTDMPQPSRGPNARRQSNYVPPISSLSLRECRIWKTMEMPELRFNVIDSNWKIKRELQALNKADLEAWMDLINQGIDYANELYASERDVHTSDASTQPNNSNGSTNSRPSREKKHMQLQFEQQQQQRQQQKQERERQQASKSKVAVVRKARRSGSDAALLEEHQETLADLDDEVYLWLKELGYQKYISTLRAKGFSSIDFIRETGIEKEDLNFLGIRDSGARRALTAAARALRNEE